MARAETSTSGRTRASRTRAGPSRACIACTSRTREPSWRKPYVSGKAARSVGRR
ncbi:hypothetical protein ACFPRL_28440 [Pseudoclavibacter helvolus]